MYTNVSGAATLYNISSGRSDLEIDQDLSPIFEKIRINVKKRLSWINILFPVSKNLLRNGIQHPAKSLFKVGFCAGAGYIIYLLTRGTFAGIEVDIDSNGENIFSSDKDVRLQEGLNLTNGDQAGQFMVDVLITGVVTFKMVLQEPYYNVAGDAINDCYKPYLIELLDIIRKTETKIIDENEENKDQLFVDLIKYREEVNRLYKRLEEDLKPYGEEPIFYTKSVYIPHEQNEEADIESQNVEAKA